MGEEEGVGREEVEVGCRGEEVEEPSEEGHGGQDTLQDLLVGCSGISRSGKLDSTYNGNPHMNHAIRQEPVQEGSLGRHHVRILLCLLRLPFMFR